MTELKALLAYLIGYFYDHAWLQMSKWPFLFLVCLVAVGGVYTSRFTKNTLFCRGMAGSLNLCGIYLAAVLLYTIFPSLRTLPLTLPFLVVTEESVSLLDPLTMDLLSLSPILLQLMYLMLLVDFVEMLNPGGKTILSWLFSQFVTVCISLSAYLVTVFGMTQLLPCISGKIAIIPVALVAVLFLLMFCAKFIFTVVMEGGSPGFQKYYGFFTAHKVGTLLTASALNFFFCCLLCFGLFLTEHNRLVFADANLRGMTFILFLILVSEYFYIMLYCGKKK